MYAVLCAVDSGEVGKRSEERASPEHVIVIKDYLHALQVLHGRIKLKLQTLNFTKNDFNTFQWLWTASSCAVGGLVGQGGRGCEARLWLGAEESGFVACAALLKDCRTQSRARIA